MRKVALGQRPGPQAPIDAKLRWLMDAVEKIANASHIPDPPAPLSGITAANVSFTPAGNIQAENVQDAVEELDDEKLDASAYSASDVLDKLKTVDGSGSGLDADTLDGNDSSDFATASHNHDGTYQPLDADLTAIASLSTQAAGRSVLTLSDPGADRIVMWDDSEGSAAWLALSGLTISGTSLSVDAATTSAAGVVEEATDAEVWAATDGKFIDAGHLSSAADFVSLTDNTTVSWDWTAGINFWLAINGNRTLGTPSNGIAGTWRTIRVSADDGGGPYTLSFSSNYWGPAVDDPIDAVEGTDEYIVAIYCVHPSYFVATAIYVQD